MSTIHYFTPAPFLSAWFFYDGTPASATAMVNEFTARGWTPVISPNSGDISLNIGFPMTVDVPPNSWVRLENFTNGVDVLPAVNGTGAPVEQQDMGATTGNWNYNITAN